MLKNDRRFISMSDQHKPQEENEHAGKAKPPERKIEQQSLDDLKGELNASMDGLTKDEAQRRLEKYGPNVLEEKKVNPVKKFLSYFWGPIPWMIEIAAVLSAIVQHWADFGIIFVLLLFNAVIGFWQEFQAANAVEDLKKQLALKARVKRDGKWVEIDATKLVPGDLVRLRLGDLIPADVKLAQGEYLSVDESALTGESLPVEKKIGDVGYSGSVVQQGEMEALVASTGADTYFGRTAKLVSSAESGSHFQKAVLTIGDYLIYISLFLAVVLTLVMIFRGESILTIAQFALILVVAAIPVALPAVLSMTMAIGARSLTRFKAIVTRLESIEEMAGIDILCSDKTGTLTQNKLTLSDPSLFGAKDAQEIILTGVLASKEEDQDAIDMAILKGLKDRKSLEDYRQIKFVPFDPVSKRTEATVEKPDGGKIRVTKGAPQVILGLCQPGSELKEKVNAAVDRFAEDGYRTLGVARSENEDWQFLGILPLYDPPREDSAETIQRAKDHGIRVKMVTGDNVAIAKKISSELKLGKKIYAADEIFEKSGGEQAISKKIMQQVEDADGFAQVFPEHKYDIVQALQEQDHIVGMTGDGVNDAPALKQANTGIAVSGATDAARSASDLVLTAPGLSVIVKAVEEARKIFERMNSYSIYRITETIRIMIFVVLAMTIFNFYPITTIMIILLALLNDLPIMTIAFDNTWLDPNPIRWDMRRVLTLATTLGLIGVVETFGILVIARMVLKLDPAHIQSLIYIKLAVAGHLTLIVTRTKYPFFSRPFPAPILLIAILGTQAVAAAIVGFGILVVRIPWSYVGFVWAYCLIWLFIEDWAKLRVYEHLGLSGKHHKTFLDLLQKSLHPGGEKRQG
jgi:H+-transporting ATPase